MVRYVPIPPRDGEWIFMPLRREASPQAGQQATSPHHKKQSLSSLVQVSFYSSSSKVSRSLHGMRRKLSSNPSLGHDQLALRRVSVVAVDPVSRWRSAVPGGRAGL